MKITALNFALVAAIIFLVSQTALAQQTLTFSVPAGSRVNASFYVLQEAYSKLDIAIELKELEPANALYKSNEGYVDGELFRIDGITKNYPNLIKVPVSIGKLEGTVFTINESFTVDGFESLRPYRIGVRQGIVYAERGTFGMDVYLTKKTDDLFKALISGDVDIIITNRTNGIRKIQSVYPDSKIKALAPPVVTQNFYHYLHIKHAQLLPSLIRTLKNMEASGQIEKILSEHPN